MGASMAQINTFIPPTHPPPPPPNSEILPDSTCVAWKICKKTQHFKIQNVLFFSFVQDDGCICKISSGLHRTRYISTASTNNRHYKMEYHQAAFLSRPAAAALEKCSQNTKCRYNAPVSPLCSKNYINQNRLQDRRIVCQQLKPVVVQILLWELREQAYAVERSYRSFGSKPTWTIQRRMASIK